MNIAAIFAGGVGQRMGIDIPKQFLEIYGKPIIIHTLEKFQYNDNIDIIYIGCKKEYITHLEDLVRKYNITKVKKECIIEGGSTGLETIYKLLVTINKIYNDVNVLIHDGVRPNITNDLINDNIETVKKYGSAITAIPNFETPIISNDGKNVEKYLNRDIVWSAKAPQTFKLSIILESYEKLLSKFKSFDKVVGLVDSCSVALDAGVDLRIVKGNRDNIKVTTPNDYIEILGRMTAADYQYFYKIEEKRIKNEKNNK